MKSALQYKCACCPEMSPAPGLQAKRTRQLASPARSSPSFRRRSSAAPLGPRQVVAMLDAHPRPRVIAVAEKAPSRWLRELRLRRGSPGDPAVARPIRALRRTKPAGVIGPLGQRRIRRRPRSSHDPLAPEIA
jgi:hypothetical protein